MFHLQGVQVYGVLFVIAVGSLIIGVMIGKKIGWNHAERFYRPLGSKYHKSRLTAAEIRRSRLT